MAQAKPTSTLFNRLTRNGAAKIAAIPMIMTALLVFFYGTGWTVYHSFTKPCLLPKSQIEGLLQYRELWEPTNNRWWISIENLAIYGLGSMVFSIAVGFVLAALLDQKIRFENTFRTILHYPYALSFIVTGLVWQWLLNPDLGIQHAVRSLGFDSFTFDPLYDKDKVLVALLLAGLWQGTGLIMCLMLAGLRGLMVRDSGASSSRSCYPCRCRFLRSRSLRKLRVSGTIFCLASSIPNLRPTR